MHPRSHLRFMLVVSLTLMHMQAATFTWDGGAGSNTFETGTNWVGDSAPSSGDHEIHFAGSSQTNPRFTGDYDFDAVFLDSGASAFSFNPDTHTTDELTLSPTSSTTGITNNSTNILTMEMGIILGSDATFNAASGDIRIDDVNLDLNINGQNLVMTGAATEEIRIKHEITGSGTITVQGGVTVNFSGATASTFSGTWDVENGTVTDSTGTAILDTADLTIGYQGVFNVFAISETIDDLNFEGGDSTSEGILEVTNNNHALTVNGDITLTPDSNADTYSTIKGTANRDLIHSAGTHTWNIGDVNGSEYDLLVSTEIRDDNSPTINKTGDGTVYYEQQFGASSTWGGTLNVNGGGWVFNESGSVLYNGGTDVVTANSGGTVGAEYNFTTANFIDHIVTTSAGVIALGADNTNNLDLSNHTSASLGAIPVTGDSNHNYSGTLTVASNTIRLGGGGGTLNMTGDFSTSTSDQVIIDVNGTSSNSVVQYTAAQDYQGDTTINGGTLLLGANERIDNNSDLILGGGTFDTGGYDETIASLTLNAASVIDLGAGDSILTFDSFSYTGGTLQIWNWSGEPGATGGTDQLIFNTPFATNLDQIQFYSDSGTTLLGGGADPYFIGSELVPGAVPEASTWLSLGGLLGLCAWHWRRRRVRATT